MLSRSNSTERTCPSFYSGVFRPIHKTVRVCKGGEELTLRELIFGVLPDPLNLAYWFLFIDLSDPRNWFIGELQPVGLYDFA